MVKQQHTSLLLRFKFKGQCRSNPFLKCLDTAPLDPGIRLQGYPIKRQGKHMYLGENIDVQFQSIFNRIGGNLG